LKKTWGPSGEAIARQMRGKVGTPGFRGAGCSSSPPLLSLFAMLEGSRGKLAVSAFGGLLAGGGIAGLMTLIKKTLDQDPALGAGLALPYFGLCIIVVVAGTLSELFLLGVTQAKLLDLRIQLSRQILSAPLQRLQSLGPHRLLATLTDDIGNVVNSLEMLPPLLTAASTLLGGLLYMGWLSPPLLLVVSAFVLVGVAGFSFSQTYSNRWHQRARQSTDALFGHFRAVTEACKELKMNARQRRVFILELGVTADKVKQQFSNGRLLSIVAAAWGRLLFFLLIGIILFALPRIQDISRGTVTGFTLVVLFIMNPISMIMSILPTIGTGIIAWRNITNVGIAVAEEPHAVELDELPTVATLPEVLELNRVRRQYHSEGGECGFQLGPLDLRIEPGELVFVTGGNGSGKTTLALLLLGLYPPDEGELRLGGAIITEFNREYYRQHFAAVFSDAYVFESLLSRSSDNFSELADELLVRLQLDHKVQILDGRFSTVNLSKGQRKRLALLSAYLEDRPFYLLDEWAAEQDPVFRKIFYEELLPQLKARGKTIIVITHDDRYFHLADRVLRLNMGQIDEQFSTDIPLSAQRRPCA